jgi:NSS family neurotransmitter:Na+ symporter
LTDRGNWGGRLGFVLAAAGSAVGLGNLWKFPYVTWNNHGAAFVLAYLACIAVLGLPVILSEILIGKTAQTSPVPAFGQLGFPKWRFVGWLGVITGLVILSFYTVIAGWSISSFVQCLGWTVNGYQNPATGAFDHFLAQGSLQLGLTLVFSMLTAAIVLAGVAKGIEKATKILMPALFLLILILVVRAMLLPGFGQALRFLLVPDFSHFGPQTILEALGQAFFTLSLGMGAMITYGSYMKRDEKILRSGVEIAILDTLVAFFACIIMYSIIFSFQSLQEQVTGSSIGMLFVVIPQMFYTQMPGGSILAPLFYLLVGFAALSSTISLLEVIVASMIDHWKMKRRQATLLGAGLTFVLSIFCALSLGANTFLSGFKLFGNATDGIFLHLNQAFTGNKSGILAIFDHVAANWFLPLGALLITLFVGWVLPREHSQKALGFDASERNAWVYRIWFFLVRFVAPLSIGWILVSVLGGKDFS